MCSLWITAAWVSRKSFQKTTLNDKNDMSLFKRVSSHSLAPPTPFSGAVTFCFNTADCHARVICAPSRRVRYKLTGARQQEGRAVSLSKLSSLGEELRQNAMAAAVRPIPHWTEDWAPHDHLQGPE
jgi:hypothetical protein